MKVKIRDCKAQDKIRPLQLPPRNLNLGLLPPVHRLGIHLLEKRDRLLNALLQFWERGFGVFEHLGSGLGDTHSAAFAGVADPLDLVGEVTHVGEEAALDQGGFAAVGGGMVTALLEQGGEGAEIADEDGDGDVVQR